MDYQKKLFAHLSEGNGLEHSIFGNALCQLLEILTIGCLSWVALNLRNDLRFSLCFAPLLDFAHYSSYKRLFALFAKNGHSTPPLPEKIEHQTITDKILTYDLLIQHIGWFNFAVFSGSH